MRCKFICEQISEQINWNREKPPLKKITLKPVSSGGKENAAFYAATPKGLLELDYLRGESAGEFKLGTEYYIDITEAPASEPQPS